jgi:RNA polymerase sigma-70 factor (ECF subfamily)
MADETGLINRILDEWQAGINREEHFSRLFEEFYRPVYRFFEKRGFSADECHDLTQETFLRVYKGLGTFRRESRFETWLFQIAANTYQKALRWQSAGKRAGQHVSWESLAEQGAESSDGGLARLSSDADPLDEVLGKEQKAVVRQAIEALPEQMRKCLMLRVDQELSYQDIAVVMRISVETVKAHLFQSRQRLKEQLAEYFGQIDW